VAADLSELCLDIGKAGLDGWGAEAIRPPDSWQWFF